MREVWITAYEETQKYAGPEEEGRFYWTGIPMWSQTAFCHCQAGIIGPVLKHDDVCPVHHLVREAEAFIKGLTSGYLESYTSRDAEEPEHRGESIYRKHIVRVEDTVCQAYGLHPPEYE